MKSTKVIDQIRKLRLAGYPIKKIALSLGISKNTVRRYFRQDDFKKEAESICEKPPKNASQRGAWKAAIDWPGVCEKRRQGYTAKQLFADCQPQVTYARFCDHLRQAVKDLPEIAVRLSHNPAEKIQIDFCDGIAITDHRTGKKTKTQLFIGVLPFSSYCFGIFVADQKSQTFIRAHEAMWSYFGGVTPYVVIDNLKAGVKKAHLYDPELNPTYCDYANHAGFAVLPARPYTPRDKAAVEACIGAIQRSFYQEMRDQAFYTLHDLNTAFAIFLEQFNNRVMQDYGISRRQRFTLEQPSLLPRPEIAYDFNEWREAKVHPDCCVQIEKSFYSVPYQYRGQVVRIKIGEQVISIFDQETNTIACHKRAQKVGTVTTDERHYPDKLVQSNFFDIKKALAQAEAVGPKTEQMIISQLSGDRPLRYLRRVQGILRLLEQGIHRDAIEFASAQALTFSKFQLAFIKSCAQQFQSSGKRPAACRPLRDPDHIFLHGGFDV